MYIHINNKNYKAGTSWTAKNSDFAQQLIIDLGSVRNISLIAIQGRPHSVEYVTEFTISYGYNGLDYADFKEPGGNIKVTETSVFCSYFYMPATYIHQSLTKLALSVWDELVITNGIVVRINLLTVNNQYPI